MMITSARLSLLIFMVVSVLSVAVAMNNETVPDFDGDDCMEFRRRLQNHTLISFYDRRHATNLGIAAMAIFWTGLPAVPLGIASAWTGRRQSTPAMHELSESGVNRDNFEEINRLCAILVRSEPVRDATMDGKNRSALALGASATVLALFVFLLQSCYTVFALWRINKRCKKEDEEESEDVDDLLSSAMNIGYQDTDDEIISRVP